MKNKFVAPTMGAIVLTTSAIAFGTLLSPPIAVPQPTESGVPRPTESGTPSVAKPTILKAGSFVAAEQPTKGTARIISNNGKYVLELSQAFSTDSGPDLFVILHKAPNILAVTKPPYYSVKEGDYVILGALKKTTGRQIYSIPSTVKISDFNSAAIWCRKYNATFGAASFKK